MCSCDDCSADDQWPEPLEFMDQHDAEAMEGVLRPFFWKTWVSRGHAHNDYVVSIELEDGTSLTLKSWNMYRKIDPIATLTRE